MRGALLGRAAAAAAGAEPGSPGGPASPMIRWRNLLADVTVQLVGDAPEGAGEREARFAVTGFLCGL